MLVEHVSPATDQPESRAVGQHCKPLVNPLSEIMDLFMAGVDQPQTDWPNDLAEGPQDIVT